MILRKLKKEDAEPMLEWMSDPRVNQFFRFDVSGVSIEKCQDFITQSFTETNHHYAIESNGEYMGTISLKHIDTNNRTAEYAIAIRFGAQGQGLGQKASRELLDIAFNELNLNKIYLDVLSENQPAIHLYQKLGFIEEGELREQLFIHNEFKNLKLFGMTRSDYEKL